MIIELFLTILIILVIYFLYFNDSRIEWEAYNGKKYKIKNDSKEINQQKADLLAKLEIEILKLMDHMVENKLPTEEIAKRLRSRYDGIGETPQGEKSGAAYTINKGHIYCCLITKGKLNNLMDCIFVLLHELAHLMSNSYGHGPEFKQNFNFIVKLAVKLGIWKDPKYENRSVDYCGVKVTNSPCTGDQCTKDNLNYYFKESLLDYK